MKRNNRPQIFYILYLLIIDFTNRKVCDTHGSASTKTCRQNDGRGKDVQPSREWRIRGDNYFLTGNSFLQVHPLTIFRFVLFMFRF